MSEKKKKKWIKGAIKHPGRLHRALGVPEGTPIPEKKLEEGERDGGSVARMVALARTLKTFHR